MSDHTVNLSAVFRPIDGEEVTMRPLVLGMAPVFLIEITDSTEEEINISIDSTGPNDAAELSDFLEVVVDTLRASVDTSDFPSWDMGDMEPEGVFTIHDRDGMPWIRSVNRPAWKIDDDQVDWDMAVSWGMFLRYNGPLTKSKD